jgi:hypothetical protein
MSTYPPHAPPCTNTIKGSFLPPFSPAGTYRSSSRSLSRLMVGAYAILLCCSTELLAIMNFNGMLFAVCASVLVDGRNSKRIQRAFVSNGRVTSRISVEESYWKYDQSHQTRLIKALDFASNLISVEGKLPKCSTLYSKIVRSLVGN